MRDLLNSTNNQEEDIRKTDKESPSSKKWIKISLGSLAALLLAFFAFTGIRAWQFKEYTQASKVSNQEVQEFQKHLLTQYGDRSGILKDLPYKLNQPDLEVWAKSFILIDTANGNILCQKNADEVIPPASMTKLFSMYLVEEAVSAGKLSYDQVIPLPPECWACNMPPHSSLMFLGEGQKVTLEELLLGLSICSGNDAAYALAYATCGSMEAFVEGMNQIAYDLGLTHTHFVESSGYSEENTTTAREMAAFCRVYLERHPSSIERFHSVQKFTYPKEHNLAPGDTLQAQDFTQGFPRHITMSITQRNTNPLLGTLDGVDGLKTGYIDESGYNLALTARRIGTRFLSVTMGGPGNSTKEGQQGRVHDGTELMEWAFKNFKDFSLELYNHPYFLRTFAADQKGINLIPAYSDNFLTVPYISGQDLDENLSRVKVYLNIDEDKWGHIALGEECGSIKIVLDDYLLQEIPLLADREVKQSNFIVSLSDKLIKTALSFTNKAE
ncbi:MAG: D-alanyl-D-alanine carboxypeptidase [Treponema sp.]|nr:D-alanyl-D-alanine carboxypeptidase [Treponema sp.]